MAKFRRSFSFDPISDSGKVPVTGCHNFSFYNGGNVNVTINRVLVLLPGDSWPNLDDNFDIECEQDFDITFNVGSDITPPPFEAAVPGFNAPDGSGTNAGGKFDTRVVLIKTHLSPA